jgi:glutathione S-transferase
MVNTRLIIGNKLYSSWSLRAWLLMKALDLPFEETVVPLYQPDTRGKLLQHSPAAKVPILIDGVVTVWESIAIIECLAEKYPEKGIWPRDARARSHARAISAEMHAGFAALRQACPMNLGKRFAPRDRGDAVRQDVARVSEIFRSTRSQFGTQGAFLYGDFSGADAMYAPIVTRLETYSIEVDAVSRRYMDAVLRHTAFRAWREAALAEPWVLAGAEVNEPTIELFRDVRSEQAKA